MTQLEVVAKDASATELREKIAEHAGQLSALFMKKADIAVVRDAIEGKAGADQVKDVWVEVEKKANTQDVQQQLRWVGT